MLKFQNNLLKLLPSIQTEVFIEIWILRNFCCEANNADNGFFSKLSEMSSRQTMKRSVSYIGRSWILITWRVFKHIVGADGRDVDIRLCLGSQTFWPFQQLRWLTTLSNVHMRFGFVFPMKIMIVFEKNKICGNRLGSGGPEPCWGYCYLLSGLFICHGEDIGEVTFFVGATLRSCDQNPVISLAYKYLTFNEKTGLAKREEKDFISLLSLNFPSHHYLTF